MTSTSSVPAIGLTSAAMIAFAANSLLCRLAMGDEQIDPVGFTAVRLASGALMLALLMSPRRSTRVVALRAGSWPAAFWLFAYAITFSFAYVGMPTGTGALLAFGAVQITMILSGLRSGERPHAREWLGLAIAVFGTVYLLLPGVDTPEPAPATFMIIAGVSWGLYSLRGRGATDPAAATCGNFVRTLPMIAIVALCFVGDLWTTTSGVVTAIASGAIASALGYVVWYKALAYLTATRAAIVQLSAPMLAAVGGVLFLGETFTQRLGLASICVLSGVALAASSRSRPRSPSR